ncbi:MAG TPA: choice-of-anchor J domain-containing protein, partial [Candidatus Cloacimonas sp.]|nr:choice-of-anchor J domain-containing protein [Candidatus Cloacimonas sp.]
YIKISTDNGNTWTVLWDATAQTGGWNYYTTPISVDLNAYAGQQIKLAWHADDPPSADGMWYVWFVDDVVIGSPSKVITFSPEQLFAASQAPTAAPKIVYPTSPISREVVNNNNETQHNATVRSLPPTATVPTYNGNRVLVGYQVWRLLQGQETNESAWTILTSTPITNLTYADNGWASLPDGTYKWAVKAVYTGGAYSVATLSNPLPLYHEIGTIAGIVRNMQNQPISGATVTCGDVTATTNASGAYSMSILSGTHSVTASHPNYQSVTQTGIIVVTGQTTTVNFQLPPTADLFSDGFETYPDFTLTFAPWTLVDVDQIATYGVQGYTWENIYTAQAFIIFNPTATTPAMTSLVAHGGNKLAACFNATTPPNNDWMITPQFDEPNSIKFWARSYTSDYGLERFKVGVSSTTNPANFTIISGPTYVQAPEEWTEYTYQISQPGPLYIGINCVSNDAFFLCIDDVTVTGGDINDPEVPVVATALHNNYPNPFNPETTISYSVKETGPVTIDVYNVKGQLVKSLVKGIQEPGNHTIVWNGTDNNGRSVSSGVYYYKMNAGKYSSTKKMIMMK